MSHVVYCIIDPRDLRPFYVGHTGNLDRRKRQHIETGHGASGLRIANIKENGFIPLFALLETCPSYAKALRSETFWIEILQSRGLTLLNKENPTAPGPPNAGKPWSRAADAKLRKLHRDRLPLPALCKELGRSRGAILSRLQRLGLTSAA